MSEQSIRGRSHVALNRHKLGSWNTLFDILPKEIIVDGDGGSHSSNSSNSSNVEQKDEDGK